MKLSDAPEQAGNAQVTHEVIGGITLIEDGPGLLRRHGEFGARPTASTESRG